MAITDIDDGAAITDADVGLLLELVQLDTVSPLENGQLPPAMAEAQNRLADVAAGLGFSVLHHEPVSSSYLDSFEAPAAVTRARGEFGEGFLASQPNMVLLRGSMERKPVVMFNVHLDTVGPLLSRSVKGGRVFGRGAVDAKGPAVGLFAGIRAACATAGHRRLPTILVQLVCGEEGGCMGVIGTRPLVEAGFTGDINIFCEPTGCAFIDSSTSSMSAVIRVEGTDTIDDMAPLGQNATVLLSHIACRLAAELDPLVHAAGGQLCIAGLTTGDMHNRVYGSGSLAFNISYGSLAAAADLERATERTVTRALRSFAEQFRHDPTMQVTAARAEDVVSLHWQKRGLPALERGVRTPRVRALLRTLGVDESHDRFTCDAIWMEGRAGDTFVFGPGRLDENGAHADNEHVDVEELETFAKLVAALLISVAEDGAAE